MRVVHEGINFTSNSFNNLGIGTDKADPDAGRYLVTMKDSDWGAFKAPTLRDNTQQESGREDETAEAAGRR